LRFIFGSNLEAFAAENQYPTFKLEQLSKYDGKSGNKAYIAYNGFIYDISKDKHFKDGFHVQCMRTQAGKDITELMGYAPKKHRNSNFMNRYEIVGILEGANISNLVNESNKGGLLDKKEVIVSLG